MKNMNSGWNRYGEQTGAFLNNVETYLKTTYGEIQPHWFAQLQMLAVNHQLFLKSFADLSERGMLIEAGGRTIKNPSAKYITECEIQILKILNEFGLTPKSAKKLNIIEQTDEDDPLMKFISLAHD